MAVGGRLDALDLEADTDQGVAELTRRRAFGQVDVLGHPAPPARASGLHPECLGEPNVALDHVAHVGDVVAEHHRPLDAHAEREAGVAAPDRCRRRAARAG